jgi:hypothetical protein
MLVVGSGRVEASSVVIVRIPSLRTQAQRWQTDQGLRGNGRFRTSRNLPVFDTALVRSQTCGFKEA